ncbi:hypothetical protein QFC22_003800 [Naganishia vaughanmartiniae]|uniref:Uncharacterized protein n=1 Tax=Naganishia vaughanmartiniae TaxID=1424756 RepID=A0ACC2X4R3_9TREE|nr:hypothetical protein QFC22_003800 [Naganishia vaughanmartiniae]
MAATFAKGSVSAFARIAPYLPHPLQTAPQAIALHLLNPSNNDVPWYRSYSHFHQTASDPFHTVLPLLGTAILGSYVMSVIMRNASQIDRMWTTFPVIYSWHFALFPLFNQNGAAFAHNLPRVWLMVAMQIVWSVRLTYHTWRRGLYSFNEEDYRYTVWRTLVPTWFFELFSFFFISIGQSVLLLIMALPVHNALVTPLNEHKESILPLPLGLHLSDVILVSLSLLDIYIQWNADNQQYEYQTYKHALKASPPDTRTVAAHKAWQHGSSRIEWTSRDIKRGFLTRHVAPTRAVSTPQWPAERIDEISVDGHDEPDVCAICLSRLPGLPNACGRVCGSEHVMEGSLGAVDWFKAKVGGDRMGSRRARTGACIEQDWAVA